MRDLIEVLRRDNPWLDGASEWWRPDRQAPSLWDKVDLMGLLVGVYRDWH